MEIVEKYIQVIPQTCSLSDTLVLCSFCHGMPFKAHLDKSGSFFCLPCLKQAERSSLKVDWQNIENAAKLSKLAEVSIKCPHSECYWSGQLGILADWHIELDKKQVKCPFCSYMSTNLAISGHITKCSKENKDKTENWPFYKLKVGSESFRTFRKSIKIVKNIGPMLAAGDSIKFPEDGFRFSVTPDKQNVWYAIGVAEASTVLSAYYAYQSVEQNAVVAVDSNGYIIDCQNDKLNGSFVGQLGSSCELKVLEDALVYKIGEQEKIVNFKRLGKDWLICVILKDEGSALNIERM